MTYGQRLRATYDFEPTDRLYRTEFYFWPEAIERWKSEGLPEDWEQTGFFGFDETGFFAAGLYLGWTEPPFIPEFDSKVVERHGDHDIVQDNAGRLIKIFTGRTHGFMPDYLKHPVANLGDWENLWQRLDPSNESRWVGLEPKIADAAGQAALNTGILRQPLIGGYMFLRSIIGPEDLLYMIYDQPGTIHAAMQGWLALMGAALERIQRVAELDEIYIAEDICYNHRLLISPDSMREFLLPYYQDLLRNARARQSRKLHVHIDTDGDCRPAIPIYSEIGMTVMSPFEVASGCNVAEIARQYPDLVMSGGIDKRVLAAGKDEIDKHIEEIMPFMVERGGYYPTCDHGVPDDVSLENYLHYRKRIAELGG